MRQVGPGVRVRKGPGGGPQPGGGSRGVRAVWAGHPLLRAGGFYLPSRNEPSESGFSAPAGRGWLSLEQSTCPYPPPAVGKEGRKQTRFPYVGDPVQGTASQVCEWRARRPDQPSPCPDSPAELKTRVVGLSKDSHAPMGHDCECHREHCWKVSGPLGEAGPERPCTQRPDIALEGDNSGEQGESGTFKALLR